MCLRESKTKKNEKVYHFEMMEVQKGVTENGHSEISFVESSNPDTIQIVTRGAFSLLAKMKNTEEDEGGHGH